MAPPASIGAGRRHGRGCSGEAVVEPEQLPSGGDQGGRAVGPVSGSRPARLRCGSEGTARPRRTARVACPLRRVDAKISRRTPPMLSGGRIEPEHTSSSSRAFQNLCASGSEDDMGAPFGRAFGSARAPVAELAVLDGQQVHGRARPGATRPPLSIVCGYRSCAGADEGGGAHGRRPRALHAADQRPARPIICEAMIARSASPASAASAHPLPSSRCSRP